MITQDYNNFTKWVNTHPLIARNQSHRITELETLQKIHRKQNQHVKNVRILEEIAAITIQPIKVLEFTNNFKPLPFPGINVGQGIHGVVKDISETGLAVINQRAAIVTKIADQGINALSGPLKIVVITVSIMGGLVISLVIYKHFRKEKDDTIQINSAINLHPHIWKKYNEYYGK